jgi:hypothetical protein
MTRRGDWNTRLSSGADKMVVEKQKLKCHMEIHTREFLGTCHFCSTVFTHS